MGTSITPVVTDAVGIAPDAAALARFCWLDSRQQLAPQAARMHAPDAMYLLEREGRAEGRCSLWWNDTPQLPGQRVGLIGHFSVPTAESAGELLGFACAQLRAAGCTMAVGPMDGSTWRHYRLITWRASDPLFFLEPDNPAEWPAYFEAAGFAPLAQYYSSKCDDLRNYPPDTDLDARLTRSGYRRRPLDVARLDDELATLWRMATDAFAGNYLYSPISETEFRQMYAPAIRAIRPELVQIAELDSNPVAFIFALPDMLQAGATGQVETIILKTLGVLKAWHGQGIGNWLIDDTFARARTLGFSKGIFALMHEDNVSRKMGHGRMRDIRRYTLFERLL